MRRGSKAKSTRMFVPSGLSSFMFECREPSTVSAKGLGIAVGALSAGIVADTLGISWAIGLVGALTFLSGAVVAVLMRKGAG